MLDRKERTFWMKFRCMMFGWILIQFMGMRNKPIWSTCWCWILIILFGASGNRLVCQLQANHTVGGRRQMWNSGAILWVSASLFIWWLFLNMFSFWKQLVLRFVPWYYFLEMNHWLALLHLDTWFVNSFYWFFHDFPAIQQIPKSLFYGLFLITYIWIVSIYLSYISICDVNRSIYLWMHLLPEK